MASIQNTFSYENTSGQTEYTKVTIEVVFPKFSFRILDSGIKRFVIGNETFKVNHKLEKDTYNVSLPLTKLVDNDIKDIYGFFMYHFIEIIGYDKNINDFSFQFTVNLKDEQGQVFSSEVFEGLYYKKAALSSDYDRRDYQREYSDFESTYGPIQDLNSKGLSKLPKSSDKSVFIINKHAYEIFKYIFTLSNSDQVSISDSFVLDFIQILTDLSGKFPKLSTAEDLISYTQLADFFKNTEYRISPELYRYIIDNFPKLFDFPLTMPDIQVLDIRGSMEIITDDEISRPALDFYDLTVEYSQNSGGSKILRYDWTKSENEITDNKINFEFDEDEAIITTNINGFISVRVKGFDGAILWEEKYAPTEDELKNLEIVIKEYPESTGVIDASTGKPKSPKRLRGKVLQTGDKYNLNELTIIVQGKKEGDEIFRIIAATKTDKSGNFSLDYPFGDYQEAQALVSLMPNSPADLIIDTERSNETISDDFIYLLLTDDNVVETDEPTHTHDDCGCHTTNKAKRLPDQVDLIESDEYTQDIGGSCLNLSTPNRTLREYSYNAIVRISDPDVSNYVLKKNVSDSKVKYDLVGSDEKISRNVVDLNNPIRWEDAPDASENLSIYQAVTIATGHILYYKSIFKADGYSLGDLVYSLPLAPGQKKQIVVFESSHSLRGSESQHLSQGESLSANLLSDRYITDELSGSIGENLSGRSKAHTSGMSAGLGASASYGGIGGSLGVAGGFSNSNSSASQNSSRNVSQFFGEKLRQSLLQNAESYRELNASVVTTVTEGQEYGVTSEVVANHNHCHSLTMMYFEVLRHYAIFQEISHVEECVFVPFLMTNFSTENIHKWKDVIAPNLLPIPSNTYLQPFAHLFGRQSQHPLLKAFDANERIKTNYTRVEFPEGIYAAESIEEFTGFIKLNVHIPRPKTRFDRILSFPIIRQTITTDAGVDVAGTIRDNIKDTIVASVIPCAAKGPSIRRNTTTSEVLATGRIFDMFMTLDENFESVPPAQCIRVKFDRSNGINLFRNFTTIVFDGEASGTPMDFFAGMDLERTLWESYAAILEMPLEELFEYFNGNVIGDWDRIFNEHIAPKIMDKLVNEDTLSISPLSSLQLTERQQYNGGNRQLTYDLRDGGTSIPRERIGNIHINFTPNFGSLFSANPDFHDAFFSYITFKLTSVQIKYSTAFSTGVLINRTLNDHLVDGVPDIPTPLNSLEKRNPKLEDEYLVNELIEHLNSKIEYYNKLLWTNLDPDRRYMLLDGFNIQTYSTSGHKLKMRSLASVVKNELITITGNSLVFPVSDGYRVGRDSILEDIGDGVQQEIPLIDFYKPLTPVPPYRISVPTRGVFMEAIQGSCDACEMVKEDSSQDWDKFRTEEPTPISPVITPTPTITNYQPNYKDFAQPLVNIQNAPDAPAPAAGLAQLNELLGRSGAFNDITGLAGNQDNVIRTYLSNQENAKAFAEMSKSLATQQHNTSNAESISEGIDRARSTGAISDEEAQDLTRQHLQQQIDGGESSREIAQFERERDRPSLSQVVAEAAGRGQSVEAERTDADGTREQISIDGDSDLNASDRLSGPPYNITPLQQIRNSCWATVATMISNWRTGQNEGVIDVLREAGNRLTPSDENKYIRIYENTENNGLPIDEVDDFINVLNLTIEPLASITPADYYRLLITYGPLWINIDSDSSTNFSPHAKILINMTGNTDGDPGNITMSFVDPALGRIVNQSFTEFIQNYEQLVYDAAPDANLISQIIHFREQIERSGSAPVLGTGGSTSTLSFRLRNIHIPSSGSPLGNVGEARIEIKSIDLADSDDPNLLLQTSANGRGSINIDGLSAGTYFLNIIPAETFTYSLENIRQNVGSDIDKIYESSIGVIQIVVSVNDSGRRSVSIPDEVRSQRVRISQTDYENIVEISGMEILLRLQPLWLRSNNIGVAPYGRTREIRNFVIHHTGNSAANRSINTFIGGDEVSIHYLMDINGRLIKMVNENQIAKHAGNSYWNQTFRLNDSSLGIEICNGNGENYSVEQIDTLVLLLRDIVDDGTLPADCIRNIIGHSDIATTFFSTSVEPDYNSAITIESSRRIQDPGPLFDWKRLERENLTYTTHRDSANDAFYLNIFGHIANLTLVEGDNDSSSLYGGRSRTLDPTVTNNVIQLIQNDLKAIGYLVNTDGVFSLKTEEAIKVFRVRAFSNTDRTLLPSNIDPDSGNVYGSIDFATAKKIRDYSPLSDPSTP